MTYYKQFAEMLGLELEQEFSLVTHNGEKANANTYKIKEDGLYCQSATKIIGLLHHMTCLTFF